MEDRTEGVRRLMIAGGMNPDPAEKTWTTAELQEDYEVLGFLAPFVHVRRKADGVKGTLLFRHNPRVYYSFEPE